MSTVINYVTITGMKLRLVDKINEMGDIWTFIFEPAEDVQWVAGQSIRLELPKKTWGIDERRFSIASAPYEKRLQITTKISESDFKQALSELKPGEYIDGFAVEGTFVWGKEIRHRLFIAGGIGITPYRAMLLERLQSKKPINATLIHAYSEGGGLFTREFEKIQKKDQTFVYIPLPGKRLVISANATLPDHWLRSKIYISGPEKMVKTLYKELLTHNVDASEILQDEFTGNIS